MRTEKYKEFFTKDYMMGPNSVRLLDEMLTYVPEETLCGRILDLGCGMAITSLFLARETAAESVFATDLWISATENLNSIRKWGEEKRMIPIHAEASELPYADGFFDAVVSVDAYHYFGCRDGFFAEKILPLIKPGGYALIAIPGVKEESDRANALMKEWLGEDVETFHSGSWWKNHIKQGAEALSVAVYESKCFDLIWKEWFESGHEYALRDKTYLEQGLAERLNFSIIVVNKER